MVFGCYEVILGICMSSGMLECEVDVDWNRGLWSSVFIIRLVLEPTLFQLLDTH